MSIPSFILLVNANPQTSELVFQVLNKAGYEVREAADGEDGLRIARAHRPTLILLDPDLPDLPGFEVLHRLRSDPDTENLPVVLIGSSTTASEEQAEGLDHGAEGYLILPCSEAELVARIRLHLRQAEIAAHQRSSANLLHDLGERVKELRLHHGAAKILLQDHLPLNQLVADLVKLIPPAMEVPACAEARIVIDDSVAATPGYLDCENRFSVEFPLRGGQTARIDVAYVRDLPNGKKATFLDEERKILSSLGEMLCNTHERRWVEAERSRGETLLRIAGQVARIGGWSFEIPEKKLTWSEEVCTIHEVSPGQQPGLEEAINFYPLEYRAEVSELVRNCIRHGQPFQFEMELITAKGRRIPVRAIGEAVYNEAGEIIRVQGAFQDLSEIKAAEASVEASERRFRQLAESMPMIVWTANPDGNIIYSNQKLFEATGAQPTENPHTRWQPFVHPDDLPEALDRWEQCVREEIPYEITYRILHQRDNEYHWFRVQAQPVRGADGTLQHWFGTGIDIHETKCLEERATQLAERLTRTLESITDGFFTLDREWRFTYLNPELESILGKERQTLVGKTIWDEYPDILGTSIEKAYRKAADENVTVHLETFYTTLERWIDLRIYPSADGLSVFTRDMTQQKNDEEQVRLLATAIASLNDIVMITKASPIDEPGPEIVFVNEAFERMTGYTSAEALGKNPRILQGPGSDIDSKRRMRKALEAGRHVREEMLNYTKDGREYLVEINIHPVRDAEGNISHFVAVERDITAERSVKDTLRESEGRFRTLLRDIPTVAVQGYRIDGAVQYWNKASEVLYGYTEEEALRSNLLDLIIPPDMRNEVRGALQAIENGAEHIPTQELSLLRKDGSRVDVLSSHAILRRKGRPVELFCIDIDLTERKQLEAQFLRAQRMESIGTLAGGIAHDLNNMLSPVIMGVSLLRQLSEGEKNLAVIDTVQKSAERGRELVKQVLSFARGADGVRLMVNVAHIVNEIESLVKSTFPKNISFEQEIPADLWKIQADPTQINQVLVNLCVNSRDAMPNGGRLRIAAENLTVDQQYASMFAEVNPGRYILLEVSDEGFGMDSATKDRVFEPFFTTKELGDGTGLGLSTVMGIVRGHNGFINVYSEPGAGTRFNVYLPAEGSNPSAADESTVRIDESILRSAGECILIVDDEASIRNMSKLTLEAYGYRVITASDGAEATGVFADRREEIDLLLTDIMMPVMDGIALIRAIQHLAPNLPILAASGLKANSKKAPAAEYGVTGFLSKPYTAETLLFAVQEALAKRKV